MKRPTLLISAYALDHLLGDPESFPHPVRLIGFAIDRGERLLRRPNQSPSIELLTGATLTVAIVATAYTLTDALIRLARCQNPTLGNLTEILLAWTCLAARNLHQEAAAVLAPLVANDLPAARQRLARIVGRDTESLDSTEISRALVETLAESASDGIVAPLFYLALGGAPLAMAYKAVNTLDSMIGHTDSRYFYFGKAAARLDDAANFLANPQNPSGVLTTKSVLLELVEAAAHHKNLILLDEAFIDYTPTESLSNEVAHRENLVVFRSVTKFHALPGLRVAYALAHPTLTAAISRNLPPWPITTLAAKAVSAALADHPYIAHTITSNAKRRASFAHALESLGILTLPSSANFLLLRLPDTIDCNDLWQNLILDHHIVLRNCANYEALPPHYLRTAVRTEPENQRLVAALQQSLAHRHATA